MLTPQQEEFARLVAKGKSYSDAYRGAYNTKNCKIQTINNEASKLKKDPEVTAMIEKIKNEGLKHLKYGIEEHYLELEEAKQLAYTPRGDNGKIDLQVAIKAIELKGKLKGLYVDRSDVELNNKVNVTIKRSE